MKKFKKNLKKLFAISVCTTLLTSLIFVNTNAAENNKSSKIAKSETIKSTTHLQNRSIKYRKGKRNLQILTLLLIVQKLMERVAIMLHGN